VTRHLTHRFWFCFVAGWAGLAATLISGEIGPLALTSPFLGALAFSIADGWWPEVSAGNATVSSPRVIEGDELEVSIDLMAPRTSFADVEVQFPPTLTPVTSSRMVSMIRGRTRFVIGVRADRWGAAGPEWVVVVSRDRLGISEQVVRYPVHVPVRVHPPAERLASLIPLYRERPVTGEHRSKSKGAGSEFAEIRPYRYGDPVRSVHPQLSARRGKPMVIERHPDRSSTIVLLVDSAQDLGVDMDTTLRWTVTAAMALGERHLRAQDRLGLLDIGRSMRWIPTRLGRRHLHTVVDALLATEVFPRSLPDENLVLPSNLPGSATIVAISPLLSERTLSLLVILRSRGHEIIVIKPVLPGDGPDVSELARRIFRVGNELNERWLRQRGVTVIPWDASGSLDFLLRRVLPNLGRARSAA
jgi:uncharacterized protein (DUF58 family)